jgi:hypothetical protein
VGDSLAQREGSNSESPTVGLELSLVPVDASFIGPLAVEGYASVAEPTPLAVIPVEESALILLSSNRLLPVMGHLR